VGPLGRRNQDRGAIDSPRAVAVECPTVVAFVQREGTGSDERSGGYRDGERVDARGDQYQAGAGRQHDDC
jgi:hypothetical protein